MSWLSDTISKFGRSITKRAPAILTGGLVGGPLGAVVGATGLGDKILGGVDSLMGGDARDAAAQYGAQADQYYNDAINNNAMALDIANERRTAMEGELDNLRNRAETIYDPMERDLAAQVSGPADLESAAATARGEFTSNFDQSTYAAREQLMQMGVRPNAAMQGRQERQTAYDRARGATDVANRARTEEDDQHFLRQSTFYAQNGSGIRERLRSGMSDMYGADYAARQNATLFSQSQGDRYQSYSNDQNAQAGAGLSSLFSLGGTVLGGLFGGPAGAAVGGSVGSALSNINSGGQPTAQGSHGTSASIYSPTLYEPGNY